MDEMNPLEFSNSITPVCSTVLELPPCCIEFVPGQSEFFVVGTYDLEKGGDGDENEREERGEPGEIEAKSVKPQSRSGSLVLFRSVEEELTLAQTLKHPSAILDLHFLPDSTYFAIADSTGCISIFRFLGESIEHVITHQVFSTDLLILSFAWNPKSLGDPMMAVTLSDGTVHVLRFKSFATFEHLNSCEALHAHKFGPSFAQVPIEAWCCSWVSSDANPDTMSILTGGDDSKIRYACIDTVLDEELEVDEYREAYPAVWKAHDAGVTAILPLPMPMAPDFEAMSPLLLTGSYDCFVKVLGPAGFPAETEGEPIELSELNLGGGVWKLKLINHEVCPGDGIILKFRILASCMHAGARILDITCSKDGEWRIAVQGSVTIHKSMCYGSDIQPDALKENSWDSKRVFVSTSFYDKLLCVWIFDPFTCVS